MKPIALAPPHKKELTVCLQWLKKRNLPVQVLHPEDEIDPEHFSCLILPGGPDLGKRPERDENEFAWFNEAYGSVPVLGICRGMQLANIALGGTLHEDIPNHSSLVVEKDGQSSKESSFHEITNKLPLIVENEDLITEKFRVNSRHHQSINELGTELAITGYAEDGTPEVMIGNNTLLVQWHPERSDVWGTRAESFVYDWLNDALNA